MKKLLIKSKNIVAEFGDNDSSLDAFIDAYEVLNIKNTINIEFSTFGSIEISDKVK